MNKRSFIPWAGSKSRIIHMITPHFGDGRIVLPFAGSLTTLYNEPDRKYVINDSNPHLVNLIYHASIGVLDSTYWDGKNNPDDYYRERKEFNASDGMGLDAANRFFYLMKHCYNGLCRYNLGGGFNTPFGRKSTPIYPMEQLETLMDASDRIWLHCKDYSDVFIDDVKSGDTVYCDPPYLSAKQTIQYTPDAKAFGMEEHERLAHLALVASLKGAKVLISNANMGDKTTQHLYGKASKIVRINAHRSVSCKERGNASELLAIYEPEWTRSKHLDK